MATTANATQGAALAAKRTTAPDSTVNMSALGEIIPPTSYLPILTRIMRLLEL